MAAELSFTKRAAAELSRCFNGLNMSSSKNSSTNSTGNNNTSSNLPQQPQQPLPQSSSSSSSTVSIASNAIDSNNSSSGNSSTGSGGFFTLANSVRSIGSAYERNIAAAKHAAQSGFRFGSSSASTASTSSVPLPSTPSRKQPPPKAPPKTARARCQNYLLGVTMQLPKRPEDIWTDRKLMQLILTQTDPIDRTQLVQVCKLWRDILYDQPSTWSQFTVRIDYSHFRRSADASERARLLRSLSTRSFDSILIHAALSEELIEVSSAVGSFTSLRNLALHCCGCTDTTLQQLLSSFGGRLHRLELISCNELSDGGHWLSACTRLRALCIADCINVADETIAAIGQTLPRLVELSVQAYHVTDQCFQYLRDKKQFSISNCRTQSNGSSESTGSDETPEDEWQTEAVVSGSSALRVLQLNNCWELSNQAVLQVAHCLPHLRHLSLAGCSKITDEAVELIAEQMRCLSHLDLSWCTRISDAALEYIACDLGECLNELLLDRCTAITDIGLGYVASMRRLEVLSVRWCVQVRDLGVQALSSMSQLRVLSLAGCSMLTPNAFRCLQQLTSLEQLELTNCPAVNENMIAYLRQQLPPDCVIVK